MPATKSKPAHFTKTVKGCGIPSVSSLRGLPPGGTLPVTRLTKHVALLTGMPSSENNPIRALIGCVVELTGLTGLQSALLK
jgi:hypothetical protein